MLAVHEIQQFETDGVIAIRNAFSSATADACMGVIWDKLLEQGVVKNDRTSWNKPVVRVFCGAEPPLVEAGRSKVLIEAYNQLLGEGVWDSGEAVSGSFPVRFPSNVNPNDTGWHIDGSFLGEDGYWVNLFSKGRGLLCLFLFTDVSEKDAPTRLLRGSHKDVAKVLQAFGDTGTHFENIAAGLPEKTFGRELMTATGKAGDVFICHPFLVHAASWPHNGHAPRAIAQAGIEIDGFKLIGNGKEKPVERAILHALNR